MVSDHFFRCKKMVSDHFFRCVGDAEPWEKMVSDHFFRCVAEKMVSDHFFRCVGDAVEENGKKKGENGVRSFFSSGENAEKMVSDHFFRSTSPQSAPLRPANTQTNPIGAKRSPINPFVPRDGCVPIGRTRRACVSAPVVRDAPSDPSTNARQRTGQPPRLSTCRTPGSEMSRR